MIIHYHLFTYTNTIFPSQNFDLQELIRRLFDRNDKRRSNIDIQFKTNRQTSSLFDNHPTLIFAIRSISKSFKQLKKKKKSGGPFRGTPSRKIPSPRILHPRSKENSSNGSTTKIDTSPLHSHYAFSPVSHRLSHHERWNTLFHAALYRIPAFQSTVPYPIYRRKRIGKRKKGGKRGGRRTDTYQFH